MVWFQCEDCGENLKKPKLPNHFRVCSAYKLSCIDCGQTFNQQTVQSHNTCISEAEKYGPKNQGKPAPKAQANKPDKPKSHADVDINVGLSSRPPWFCSLCNTTTTSKQTLLLHAEGKKHRAKAKAFHAQNQSNNNTVPNTNENPESNGSKNSTEIEEVEEENNLKRKREDESKEEKNSHDLNNGEVIQTENEGPKYKSKKKKVEDENTEKEGKEATKIKWKKIIFSTLKSSPDGVMKIKKLQKLVIKVLKESGVTGDKDELREKLMNKINSSSRLSVDDKHIRLVAKAS